MHKAALAAVTDTPWNTQRLKHDESVTHSHGNSTADTPIDRQLYSKGWFRLSTPTSCLHCLENMVPRISMLTGISQQGRSMRNGAWEVFPGQVWKRRPSLLVTSCQLELSNGHTPLRGGPGYTVWLHVQMEEEMMSR